MIEVEIDKEVYLPCYHHLLEDNDIVKNWQEMAKVIASQNLTKLNFQRYIL